MRYYTNSEMSTYKDCKRRWWLGTYRRLRLRARTVVGAAPLGTRVHKALAAWYVPDGQEQVDPRESLVSAIESDRAALIESLPDDPDVRSTTMKDFESEVDLARAMIEGYVEWLAETGADQDLRVIAPEQTISYEFAPGKSLAGRLDVLVERISDGSHLDLDHKTGDFTTLRRMLPQDEQRLLYEILRRATFPDQRSDGTLLNMIRKVKRTARAKPPFYDRAEARFNHHQIENAWYRVMGTISEIERVTGELDAGASHQVVVPSRPTRDCHWKCEFYPVCPMFDDGSRAEDMIQSLYVQGDPLDRYPDLMEGQPDE